MARDRRTRLNGEIAERYGTPGATSRTPGREPLSDDLEEPQDALDDAHAEADQAAVPEAAGPQIDAPNKSLFELPRKEPARPSLLGGAEDAGAAASPRSRASSPFRTNTR